MPDTAVGDTVGTRDRGAEHLGCKFVEPPSVDRTVSRRGGERGQPGRVAIVFDSRSVSSRDRCAPVVIFCVSARKMHQMQAVEEGLRASSKTVTKEHDQRRPVRVDRSGRETFRDFWRTRADFGVGVYCMSPSRDWRPGFEQQTARINVTDDTWRRFRQLCLDDDEHVSVVLGRLVDQAVERRRPPARSTSKPPRPRVNTSTCEHDTETRPAKRRPTSATSTSTTTSAAATSSAPTLFD